MAASYAKRSEATEDPTLLSRIHVAIRQVAENIKGEAVTAKPEVDKKRNYLADRVIQMPQKGDEVLTWFAWAICTSAGLAADPLENASDGDLFSTANAVWNDVAGVTAADQA